MLEGVTRILNFKIRALIGCARLTQLTWSKHDGDRSAQGPESSKQPVNITYFTIVSHRNVETFLNLNQTKVAIQLR